VITLTVTDGGTVVIWQVPQPDEPTAPGTNEPNGDQDQVEGP